MKGSHHTHLGIYSLAVTAFAIATFLGNVFGGRLAAQYGWASALRGALVALTAVLCMLAFALHSKFAIFVVIFLWGMLAFGMSPALQSGMLNTAKLWTPRAVDFASALNISSFNLGISLGEVLGSAMVARDALQNTPWTGVGLAILAQVPLTWLALQHIRQKNAKVGRLRNSPSN